MPQIQQKVEKSKKYQITIHYTALEGASSPSKALRQKEHGYSLNGKRHSKTKKTEEEMNERR